MKIYLVTWVLEPAQGEALDRKKAKNRLLSYYLNLPKKEQFQEYIKMGRKKDENK